MAYNAVNINPLDLRPSTGVGVSIPFTSPSVFTTVYTTQEQLKYNIINYLLTNKRERPFQPNFGANLRELLFEQITKESAEIAQNTIKRGVETYFPNVAIGDIKILTNPDYSTITAEINYVIANTGQSDQILLNFENG